MGLKRFVKRIARKTVDANKYLWGGQAVKDVIGKSVSGIRKVAGKNPEVAGAALTVASAYPGVGDLLGGLLGGLGQPPPPPVYDPGPSSFEDETPEPELAQGLDPKTLLLAGGALAALYVLSRPRK